MSYSNIMLVATTTRMINYIEIHAIPLLQLYEQINWLFYMHAVDITYHSIKLTYY